jgi:hypothetical protein
MYGVKSTTRYFARQNGDSRLTDWCSSCSEGHQAIMLAGRTTVAPKKTKPDAPKPDAAQNRRSPARRVKTPIATTETEIAGRAYQLFLKRGAEHGRDWEDWLLAERELGVSAR